MIHLEPVLAIGKEKDMLTWSSINSKEHRIIPWAGPGALTAASCWESFTLPTGLSVPVDIQADFYFKFLN